MKLKIERNVVLGPLTTFRVGGPADYFVKVTDSSQLIEAIKLAQSKDLPYIILGTGANLLIGDRGFRGLVILNQSNKFEFRDNNLRADSGAIVADLISASVNRKLSGLEHFAGIPSSVGGAIWQNLHFLSPDRTQTLFISDLVQTARVYEQGEVKTVGPDFFEFGYDDSVLHHRPVSVLEVTFQLQTGSKRAISQQIRSNLDWRRTHQPQLDDSPSAGSVFKKITGVGAGRLIDQAGLKGFKIGRAQVSTKHANYIVNTGSATSADIRQLIEHVQSQVLDRTGHYLETEISLVGDF